MSIPELLKTLGGQDVKTVEEWETFRRSEILDLYQNYVYGTRDIERPDDLHFVLNSEGEAYGMRVKELCAAFGDYSFPFRVYYPAQKGKKYRSAYVDRYFSLMLFCGDQVVVNRLTATE